MLDHTTEIFRHVLSGISFFIGYWFLDKGVVRQYRTHMYNICQLRPIDNNSARSNHLQMDDNGKGYLLPPIERFLILLSYALYTCYCYWINAILYKCIHFNYQHQVSPSRRSTNSFIEIQSHISHHSVTQHK